MNPSPAKLTITPSKFALWIGSRNDHEGQAIATYCSLNRIPWRVVRKATDVAPDETPVGTVPWVEQVLGRTDTPDYYPEFLQSWLHRKVWRRDKWQLGHRVFVKPADRHKRFTGFITNGTWKGSKKGPLWYSEIVEFVSEWRYYVAAGKVVAAKWACGVECEPPPLAINWPADYHGAVDFGALSDGRIALIEANSAFSCGWYGTLNEAAIYAEWLTAGWRNLKSKQP